MTDEQYYDLSERLRHIESLLHGMGDTTMIANNLKVRVNSLFDRIVNKYKRLPFGGKYVNALRDFILANIELVEVHIKNILDDKDFDASVLALMSIARGNLKVGFPLNLFSGIALSSIQKWMLDKNNKEYLKELIGTLPPVE